jgi:hypothetical protein
MSTIKPTKLDHSAIATAALPSASRRRFLIGSAARLDRHMTLGSTARGDAPFPK